MIERKFQMDFRDTPPTCLPVELDTSKLLDITQMGDVWRRYLDPVTGKEHNGAHYYQMFLTSRG